MNYHRSLILLLSGALPLEAKLPAPAVCVVPVADLVSERLSGIGNLTVPDRYALLPLSERRPLALCCRSTQLLFNERVTVFEQQGEQSFIEAPFWYLKLPSLQSRSHKNDRFWTLTKNLRLLSELSEEQRATIPPNDPKKGYEKMVTLSLPWECPETGVTYSAGTQFIVEAKDATQYRIRILNPATQTITHSCIGHTKGILARRRSEKEQRELFVTTVKAWAHGIPHTIPYVMGGASIITAFTKPTFYEGKMRLGKLKGSIFRRPECTSIPHAGVDCSGIIRLACKVAGIPLTATNSKSIARSLSVLPLTSVAQDGDILYWKGHTAIISDTKKGLLIEARGYEHEYGFVQEIPYSSQLKGISTTSQLMRAYRKKEPVQRLDRHGIHRETIPDLTIFSLLPIKPASQLGHR